MSSAPKLAKHCIQTHAAVALVQQRLQEKLDKLLETQPYYHLFDGIENHPYSKLPALGKDLCCDFSDLYAGIAELDISGNTIANAIEKLAATQALDETEVDASVMALGQVAPCSASIEETAKQLIKLFHKATLIWSQTDNKSLKNDIVAKLGKKAVANSMEVPLINVTPDCKKAVKEIKSLAKQLLAVGEGARTIGTELEQQQQITVLTTKSQDTVIANLLK